MLTSEETSLLAVADPPRQILCLVPFSWGNRPWCAKTAFRTIIVVALSTELVVCSPDVCKGDFLITMTRTSCATTRIANATERLVTGGGARRRGGWQPVRVRRRHRRRVRHGGGHRGAGSRPGVDRGSGQTI